MNWLNRVILDSLKNELNRKCKTAPKGRNTLAMGEAHRNNNNNQ